MNDDAALLRRYAEEGSEEAFTELVHRYVDLVYGAALRRTGDAHHAADVAQQVFIALAREARKLSRHPVLGAWLHTATRNAALNLMIAEQRRRSRESAALDPSLSTSDPRPDWDRVRPVLDAAIDELPEPDRAALVLRFLERREFSAIGAILRVSTDAARMRTDRALEQLRTVLARRGITSTAAALGSVMSTHPLVSAPAGLAASLAAHSLAIAGTGVGSLATLMTIKQTLLVAALSALAAFVVGRSTGGPRPIEAPPLSADSSRQAQLIASLRQDNDRLQAQLASLNLDLTRLHETNAALTAQRATPSAPPPAVAVHSPTLGLAPWEQQRAMLNNLRQIDAARAQFILENKHPPASVHELVGLNSYIKAVRTVGGEDYSGLSMVEGQPLTVTAPDGTVVTYDPSGAATTKIDIPPAVLRAEELADKTEAASGRAVEAYRAANQGRNPPNPKALIPFFSSPQDGADFVEFLEAQKAAAEAQKNPRP